jgi:hypothetical protein
MIAFVVIAGVIIALVLLLIVSTYYFKDNAVNGFIIKWFPVFLSAPSPRTTKTTSGPENYTAQSPNSSNKDAPSYNDTQEDTTGATQEDEDTAGATQEDEDTVGTTQEDEDTAGTTQEDTPTPFSRTSWTTASTQFDTTTPGFASTTPSSRSTTPGYASTTPGYASTTPNSRSTTPGFASTTPGYASTTPGYASTTPGFASTTPNSRSTTPNSRSTTPGYASTTPGYASTTPAPSVSTTPGFASTTPGFASTTPGLVCYNPNLTSPTPSPASTTPNPQQRCMDYEPTVRDTKCRHVFEANNVYTDCESGRMREPTGTPAPAMNDFVENMSWKPSEFAQSKRSAFATRAQVEKETKMVQDFWDILAKIRALCEKKYADDNRWYNLKMFYPERILLCDRQTLKGGFGKINRWKKTIYVSIDQEQDLDDPEVNAFYNHIFLHELAHTSGYGHANDWRNAFIWFLKLATEELGVPVRIQCRTCTLYGVCDKQFCPKCSWEKENTCECLAPDTIMAWEKQWDTTT